MKSTIDFFFFFMVKLKSENHSEQSALRVPLVENNEWGQLTDPITMVCYITSTSYTIWYPFLCLIIKWTYVSNNQVSPSYEWILLYYKQIIHSFSNFQGQGYHTIGAALATPFSIYLFNFFLKILYFSFYYF